MLYQLLDNHFILSVQLLFGRVLMSDCQSDSPTIICNNCKKNILIGNTLLSVVFIKRFSGTPIYSV